MIDDNWELINGEAAHEIEVLNYANQVNVIDALVHLYMFHYTGADGGCTHVPPLSVLQEFHRTATLFLLNAPGAFRDNEVVVHRRDGAIYHPPAAANVGGHLATFFAQLLAEWPNNSAQEAGAFCLWMINWVHPFKNGNGRSARAFCYACVSLKLGFVLPGKKTLIDLIMDNRDEYEDALKTADDAFGVSGTADLGPMVAFVDRLLAEQLQSF